MVDVLFSFLDKFGVYVAITGFFFWLLKRSIDKRDKKKEAAESEREKKMEAREAAREKLDVAQLQATMAAIALGEATARAVQRIPDAHCNGDMHSALSYAANSKHKLKDLLTEVGVHALHED